MGAVAGAGLSTAASTYRAFEEAAAAAASRLDGRPVDLAVLFATAKHLPAAGEALDAVRTEIDAETVVGCVAQGVIANRREIETGTGAAVWAASFGAQTQVESFHLTGADDEDFTEPFSGADLVLLFADPVSFGTEDLLARLRAQGLNPPIVGGLTSASRKAHSQVLFRDGGIACEGATGVRLKGVATVAGVSQGAAPVGPEMVVTAAERNLVYELASRPALKRLQEVFTTADPRERALLSRGLLLGVVIDENKPEYVPGDFLVRGVIGAEQESGALVVGDRIRVGQTVRFHVRDPASAAADLRRELSARIDDLGGGPLAGALLFSCNGRGSGMFGKSDHDAGLVAELAGTDSVGGFFCAGEIGPVGGQNFLHGFTATLALFPAT